MSVALIACGFDGKYVSFRLGVVKPLHVAAVDYAGCYEREGKQWYATYDLYGRNLDHERFPTKYQWQATKDPVCCQIACRGRC